MVVPTFYNTGALECSDCQAGKYSTTIGATTCIQCGSKAVSPAGSISRTQCRCQAGYTGDGLLCSPCPQGTYKSETDIACSSCDGNALSGIASTSSDACICNTGYEGDGLVCTLIPCGAGYYRNTVSQLCDPCGPGTYKSITGDGPCEPCDNHADSAAGSTSLYSKVNTRCLPS